MYYSYRFFVLWYQILGYNAPNSVNTMFTTLVPGLVRYEHPGLVSHWNVHSNSTISHGNLSPKTYFILLILFKLYKSC